jgi:V/A-type H+-transporting ATPase subunit E
MEKVSKKILDDAKQKADEIIKEAEAKKKENEAKIKEQITRVKEETERLVSDQKNREYDRIAGRAKLDLRNDTLRLKREIMGGLFNKAVNRLVNKKSDEYLRIIKELLSRDEVKEGGEGELIICEKENRIDEKFIKTVNKELGSSFTISKERRPLKGGFILRRGKVEIDASFETLVKSKKERLEMALAKILFE